MGVVLVVAEVAHVRALVHVRAVHVPVPAAVDNQFIETYRDIT